ncbi:MAG TPA: SNF2 helicase associated domain-containing protein, partial [Pirellulales bacterium]|nr:SNF2 helicase associated domain-containing protein [Pirellulales bacterium]
MAITRQGLANRCRSSLSSNDWAQGGGLCAGRRVKIDQIDPGGLMATVQDRNGKSNEVLFDWSAVQRDKSIYVECSCPRYDQGHLCEHVAATILAVDQQGLDYRVPGRGLLEIVAEDDVWEDDDGAPPDDEWDDDGRILPGTTFPGATFPGTTQVEFQGGTYRVVTPSMQKARKPQAQSTWRRQLREVEQALGARRWKPEHEAAPLAPRAREIWYRVHVEASRGRGRLVIEFCQREARLNGELGKLKLLKIDGKEVASLADPIDRELLTLLLGSKAEDEYMPVYYGYGHESSLKSSRVQLTPEMAALALPRLCATGRCAWIGGDRSGQERAQQGAQQSDEPRALAWDDGPPWQFKLQVRPAAAKKSWALSGVLHRGTNVVKISAARLLIDGLVLFDDTAARLDRGASLGWASALEKPGEIVIPHAQQTRFFEQFWTLPDLPPLDLPPELEWEQVVGEPRPRIVIQAPSFGGPSRPLEGKISFRYDDKEVAMRDEPSVFVDAKKRRVVRRDLGRERAALAQVFELGLKRPSEYEANRYDAKLARKVLPTLVAALTQAGWEVEAEGKLLRKAGTFKLSVSSGVDWFELDAQVDFEGETVGLPTLLAAAKRGEHYVRLGDGTHGMLPEEWLKRYAPLADMGTTEDGKLRFAHAQALLLDAWLEAQPNVDVDAAFERVRDRLRSFQGVRPGIAPQGFVGTLRDYQRD